MKVLKGQLAYWFPVYVWAALVFYSSSIIPVSQVGIVAVSSVTISDHYKHVLVYSFFTFLLWRAFRNSEFRHPRIFAIAVAVLYGVINELCQYFVPGRCSSSSDIFFNFAGSILIQPLILVYKKFQKLKRENG